jgi:hypothetical protein
MYKLPRIYHYIANHREFDITFQKNTYNVLCKDLNLFINKELIITDVLDIKIYIDKKNIYILNLNKVYSYIERQYIYYNIEAFVLDKYFYIKFRDNENIYILDNTLYKISENHAYFRGSKIITNPLYYLFNVKYCSRRRIYILDLLKDVIIKYENMNIICLIEYPAIYQNIINYITIENINISYFEYLLSKNVNYYYFGSRAAMHFIRCMPPCFNSLYNCTAVFSIIFEFVRGNYCFMMSEKIFILLACIFKKYKISAFLQYSILSNLRY